MDLFNPMKLFILAPTLFFLFIFNAHGETWTHDGLSARVHKTMILDNQYKSFNTLNIEFNLHSKCKDAFISVFIVKDKKLGKHKSYDFKNAKDRNNRLNFFFDGQEFIYSAEKTSRSIYENGVEFGTLPPFNLIEKIIQNKGIIDVHIGNMSLMKLEKANGLQPAIESAKSFCLKKIKD
jgi:hypothetical protein